MPKFKVLPYDPNWPVLFENFKLKIEGIVGENLTAVYHIGSTSVEGLSAKPVIDILLAVFSIDEADKLKKKFENEGFEWRGEFGIPGRRYVTYNDPQSGDRSCYIHIFESSSLQLEKHLAFRDLLRSNSTIRNSYEQIKLKLFAEYPDGKENYQNGKSDFISTTTASGLLDPEHFRIPTQVYVWIVCRKNGLTKYLLFKRGPKSGGFWQGVTGAPFAAEPAEKGASRELFEETGIGPNSPVEYLNFSYTFLLMGEWKKAYRPEVEKITEVVFYTFVEELVAPQLSHEHEQFKWCNFEECLQLLKWPNNKKSLHILHKKLNDLAFGGTQNIFGSPVRQVLNQLGKKFIHLILRSDSFSPIG